MTLGEFLREKKHEDMLLLNMGDKLDTELTNVFTSDMLSFVMANGQAGAIWVTVMCNPNSIAVAMLADMPCIVFAGDINVDSDTLRKAQDQGITVLLSKEPVFETAMKLYKKL